MADPTPPTDPPADSVCPWCSTAVTPETVTCPSCHAVLISDEEPANLPGVTAIDDKVLRGEKPPPPRNRLLSWISGEYPDQAVTPADAQAIARPDPEVQREIRRLEVEAEVASLQAEADALQFEAVVEGRVLEVPEGIHPLELDPIAPGVTDEGGADAAEPATEPESDAVQPATEVAAGATDDAVPVDDAAAPDSADSTDDVSPPEAAPEPAAEDQPTA